jgi:hypothetical protein
MEGRIVGGCLRRRHETCPQYSVTVKCRHRRHLAENGVKLGADASVLRDAIALVQVPDTASIAA